jgi:hypothetical protein
MEPMIFLISVFIFSSAKIQNTTENNYTCYKQEIIDAELRNFYFHIDSLDYLRG